MPTASVKGQALFDLDCSEKQSQIIYIPIPWDVTTSYGKGTAFGPRAIAQASPQIDLMDTIFKPGYQRGYFMKSTEQWLVELNQSIASADIKSINDASEKIQRFIEQETSSLLADRKIPIVIGGEHSVSYGAIKAYAQHYPGMGILHIDAHSDTRNAYMGYKHSHASVMYNVLTEIHEVSAMVQVGIRDYCHEEYEFTEGHDKVSVFYDEAIQYNKMKGFSFLEQCNEIVERLPEHVYLSLDIDGLQPQFCPHTGTPVPGGLDFYELLFLVKTLLDSGRKLIGFDLVEVSPGTFTESSDSWDAIVAMRLLYKLSNATICD